MHRASRLSPKSVVLNFGQCLLCALCAVGLLLPTTAFMPGMLWIPPVLELEEEIQSFDETDIEVTEEKHRPAAIGSVAVRRRTRPVSRTFLGFQVRQAERGEYRSINGTGAPLRC